MAPQDTSHTTPQAVEQATTQLEGMEAEVRAAIAKLPPEARALAPLVMYLNRIATHAGKAFWVQDVMDDALADWDAVAAVRGEPWDTLKKAHDLVSLVVDSLDDGD